MEEQLCLSIIRNQYISLTKVERKIADYVLANSHEVPKLNVAELAERAETAGSAVIRFCKSIGFDSYSDFKIRLAVDLSRLESADESPISPDDNTADVVRKVFEAGVHTLSDTLRMLNKTTLEKAVDALQNASRVCFFGVGTSSVLAVDAQYRLMQLGYQATCSSDVLFMPVMAMNMVAGEVAVAISHSGRTAATLDALKSAKEHGAFTIAITSYRESPLASVADLVLQVYPDDRTYPSEAVSARLAHLCVLDALAVSLSMRDYERTKAHRIYREQALQKIRS